MNAKTNIDRDTQNFEHVRQIARDIEHGLDMEEHHDGYDSDYPDQIMTGFDYLADALDFEYILGSDREFKSARVLVAFGGPTIWVDFERKAVDLYWWGDRATAYFNGDVMGVEEALRDLFYC